MEKYYTKTRTLFGTDIREVSEEDYFTNPAVMSLKDSELRAMVQELRAEGEEVTVFELIGFRYRKARYKVANF